MLLGGIARAAQRGHGDVRGTPWPDFDPFLNLYRRWTPDIRTADDVLLVSDFALARRYSSRVNITFYGLFSVVSVLLDRAPAGAAYRIGKALDNRILRLPFIGRYAWYALMVCHKAA